MNYKLIDLTHLITKDMTVYPGDEKPHNMVVRSHDNDGYQETILRLSAHTGTHIDCPVHFFRDQGTTGSIPVKDFFGRAIRIDCTTVKKIISKEMLEKYKNELSSTDFVLFNTGYDKWWGNEQYFESFPVLSDDGAGYLCSFTLKGIGFDTISADCIQSDDFPVHRNILGKNMVIIENLTGLNNLPERDFYFSCFPLKITNGDGSPVRAVAYIPE